MVAIRAADLRPAAGPRLGKDGRTALTVARPGRIATGDLVVFLKPVAVAPAWMRFFKNSSDRSVIDFVEVIIDGPILVDRDDVEDALEMALGGIGEVTGAGTCNGVSNLDVEVDSGADRSEVLRRIFATLRGLNLGDSVRVRPGDGDAWLRSGDWF